MMAKIKAQKPNAETRSFQVTVGGVTVKCYAGRDGRWFVTYAIAGKRRTDAFRTKGAARDRATEIAGAVHNQKATAKSLTGKDLEAYQYAVSALERFGMPLSSAIHEYIAAREKIGQASLNEAAEFFCRHNLPDVPQKTVADIAAEMVEAKRRDGASEAYLEDLNKRLPHITAALSGPIMQITRPKIEEWLRSLPVSPRSRNNFRNVTVTLWRFAKQAGYLPRDRSTEADGLPRAKAVGDKIEIFRPADFIKLISKADTELIPFLAIGAFTGLRHAELLRLEWEDVRFAQGFVEVAARKAKTAQRRLVPIQPNLAAWLAPYRGREGKVCSWIRIGRTASALAKEHGIDWPNNGLRHSYASYRLAQCQDAAKVALEMGNTPTMIFRHYRELVMPQDAAAWWNIFPEQAANVVPMSAHQGGK
jgi:integrase